MTHAPAPLVFDPRAAQAFMAALRAGLVALLAWLLRQFGKERGVPAEARCDVRETLREAREVLFCVLVATYAHRLPPTLPQRRVHDHRARRKVRSPTPSHRSAISLKRVLKRTLPKPGRSLRARFKSVFFILRRIELLLRGFRAMLAKRYTSSWIVADVAPNFALSAITSPGVRDSS